MVLTLFHRRNDFKIFKTQVEPRASGEWSQLATKCNTITSFPWYFCRPQLLTNPRPRNHFGCVPLRWFGSGSVFGDHSDHGRSNEPMNPLWTRIHRFIWSTIARVISAHWSWSGSSQRNAPLDTVWIELINNAIMSWKIFIVVFESQLPSFSWTFISFYQLLVNSPGASSSRFCKKFIGLK